MTFDYIRCFHLFHFSAGMVSLQEIAGGKIRQRLSVVSKCFKRINKHIIVIIWVDIQLINIPPMYCYVYNQFNYQYIIHYGLNQLLHNPPTCAVQGDGGEHVWLWNLSYLAWQYFGWWTCGLSLCCLYRRHIYVYIYIQMSYTVIQLLYNLHVHQIFHGWLHLMNIHWLK